MIEDEDGSLDLAEALELLFDGLLELALLYLLLGVAVGVGEAVFPAGGVVGEGDVGVASSRRRRFHSSWATLTAMR